VIDEEYPDAHRQHDSHLAEPEDLGKGGEIELLALDVFRDGRARGGVAGDGEPQQPAQGDKARVEE
jgi:hypothetical protein